MSASLGSLSRARKLLEECGRVLAPDGVGVAILPEIVELVAEALDEAREEGVEQAAKVCEEWVRTRQPTVVGRIRNLKRPR